MIGNLLSLSQNCRIRQFLKFCTVGASGLVVDMGILYLIAGRHTEGRMLFMAKAVAAETAMLNNFFWNELWTFEGAGGFRSEGAPQRLLKFHAICGVGILWAITLLYLFYRIFGFNLYLSNLLSIGIVTIWNYILNSQFNWRKSDVSAKKNSIRG